MRTFEEFQLEMKKAHDCDKCRGRIFCVSVDALGVKRCAYCNQVVNYPTPTNEEFISWLEKGSKSPGIIKFIEEARKVFGVVKNGNTL